MKIVLSKESLLYFYVIILHSATFRKILRRIYQSDCTATLSSLLSFLGGQTDIFSQHLGLSREQNTTLRTLGSSTSFFGYILPSAISTRSRRVDRTRTHICSTHVNLYIIQDCSGITHSLILSAFLFLIYHNFSWQKLLEIISSIIVNIYCEYLLM